MRIVKTTPTVCVKLELIRVEGGRCCCFKLGLKFVIDRFTLWEFDSSIQSLTALFCDHISPPGLEDT
jgi:hypothetical protein